ncbi:ubiquitin thioesterase OTUB2 isoform X3 [Mesocricetus auratus]|uniref:ubiquitinyl hydrolase 1 n=1 Tax=Mesocricetus auratus TaxID=10036 RepID=A0A3Q0CMS6_MESAU|nr:ubiquitin thioesterase OTUB2 isoform X3 [Mesocricetus auratus]
MPWSKDTLQPSSLPLEDAALPSSSLQYFIPHCHPRLHPHGLFCAGSCRRSHTKSSKTLAFPSLCFVLHKPNRPPWSVPSFNRLLQHSPGKSPSSAHSPSCLQSETSFNLISEKCDILSILRDHPENRIYQRKIQELSKRFTSIRKTKGDGNCFYRALGYSYLESLLGKSREILKFKERVLQTPNDLLAAGFEEHKFRNFFNAFYSVVELVEKDGSVSSLLKVFNDQSCSDRIVQFLRLLTSAFIRNRADFFRHFIDEEMDIKDFCTHEVEPMAMECDHVQITALSQALNIALQVEYVDEMDTALNHHVFPEAATPSVYLLYKTSHYNILYAAEKH